MLTILPKSNPNVTTTAVGTVELTDIGLPIPCVDLRFKS